MKQWTAKKNGPGDVLTVSSLVLTVWSSAPRASLWAHDQNGTLHRVKLHKGVPSIARQSYDWRVVKIILDALSAAETVFTTTDLQWRIYTHHVDPECVPSAHRPVRFRGGALIAIRALRDGERGHEACELCCLPQGEETR